jgi:hypothetical protein
MMHVVTNRRVILVGCVKSKLARRAPAKDLYCSTLWQCRRHYAEASGRHWLILSAKHELLELCQDCDWLES